MNLSYPTPHFSPQDLILDEATTLAVEQAMARLLHVLAYEKRTGKSFAGTGLVDRLFSPDVRCLFSAFPTRGATIWNLVSAGGVELEYRASPVGYHDGAFCVARFMSRPVPRFMPQPQTGTVFATPASRYKRIKLLRHPLSSDAPIVPTDAAGVLVEDLLESPHQSLEQCLLHEISHLAGAREREAVEIGNSTPSFTDLKLETYDATWLGVVSEP